MAKIFAMSRSYIREIEVCRRFPLWQVLLRVCLCCELTCRPSFFVASSLRACEVLFLPSFSALFSSPSIFFHNSRIRFEPVQYGFLRRETMSKVRCAHCGCRFIPNPRIKNQRYCGSIQCQRARKASWQRRKLATDPDYQADKKEGQRDWQIRNDHPANRPTMLIEIIRRQGSIRNYLWRCV